MTATLSTDALHDEIAVSIASAIAAANKQAHETGLQQGDRFYSIRHRTIDEQSVWEVTYGPELTFDRRGGGLIIHVSAEDNSIVRVLRGQ